LSTQSNLGTTADFSVLGWTTVTNTGPTVLELKVGLWDGVSITGFEGPPDGTAEGGVEQTTEAAEIAQSDLTIAYNDAAGRDLSAVGNPTPSDLTGLTLVGGVYAAPDKGPLGLTGTLTLDGEENPNSVWIFQTASTLITGGETSVVSLINGAQPCNVFWQVGSSATLGTDSTFVGNILAQVSITVNNGAHVEGRALARTGAVTLENNIFVDPACDLSVTTTTTAGEGTTTSAVGGTTTTSAVGGTTTTSAGGTTTTVATTVTTATDAPTGTQLPFTGASTNALMILALSALILGTSAVWVARRQRS
jgi:hypothetical protein